MSLEENEKHTRKLKKLVVRNELYEELLRMHDHDFMRTSIEKFEVSGLEMDIALKLVDDATSMLKESNLQKLLCSLAKNPDFGWVLNIREGGCNNFEIRKKLRYLPLVSVDVERSFSVYRALLSEKRQSFSEKSLRMHMVVGYKKAEY